MSEQWKKASTMLAQQAHEAAAKATESQPTPEPQLHPLLRTPEGTAALRELIEVGADAVGRGLVLASAGNLSVRLDDEHFAVTASGTWLDRLKPTDFKVLSLAADEDGTGDGCAGSCSGGCNGQCGGCCGPRPSSEWKLHHRAYRARPDVRCVLHLHPRHATVLATVGTEIRLLTLDHAYYVGSVGVTPFYPNGSDALADTAAVELARHNCVIMRHHGCSVVADSVEMAYRRALVLEDAAQATALALSLGDTATVFPADEAAHHA